ncbi:MAG: hypothetical protein FWC56_05095, partial [Phycisphaerae bacterium]|nr:hypothetical protein [Phycisphaerae bacterium]
MSTLTYAASNAVHGSNYLNEPTSKQKDEMFNDEQMTADLAYEYAMFKKTPAEREAEKKSKLAAEYERFKSGVKPTHREAAKLRIDEAQAVLHFNDTGGRELSPEQQRIRWNRIRHQMALDESDTPPQPVGFGEYLGDASWKGFKERLPVAGDVKEMKDMWAVYRAANRAAENKATDEDLETIADFYEDQAYSARDMTVAGRALNITSHVPTFASEMAIAAGLTAAMGSGVGTAPAAAASAEIIAAKAGKKVAKEAAKKALEKVVFKNLARQAGIGLLEGGVVLPLVKSGKVAADTLEGMMPTSRVYKDEQGNIATEKVADGENLLPALAKSFYRQSVEGVTEKMGGPIDRVLGSALRKAGISSKTLEAYLGKPGTSVAKLNKAFKLGGIDSVVSELLEERIGEVLMAPIDGYELPSGRQLASEALAFSVPGLAKQAIGRGIQATRWGKSQLLTPEGAAEFVREHPEAAAKLAESETPSRATIEGLVESGAVEKETWSADERRQASTLQQEAIQNVEEETENEIFQERQGQAIETDEKSEPTTTQEQELRLAERAEENSQEDIEQEHSSLVESLEYDEEYQRTVQEADDRYTKAADEFNDYVYRKNLRRPSGGKNSKPYQRWKTLTESDKKYRELLSKLTSARLQKGKMEKIAERDFKRRQIESGNINLENVGIAPIEKLPRQFQNSIRREAKYLLDYTDNEKARETLQKIANGQDGDSAVFETQKERIIAHLIGDKAVNAHDRYVNEQYGPKEPLLGIYLRNGTESILEAIDSIDQGKPNELADHVYMSMEHTPFSVKSDARGPLESLLPEYEYDEAFSIRPGRRVPSSGNVRRTKGQTIPSSGSTERLPYKGLPKADYTAEPTTAVEAPEMIELARQISGSYPLVRKLMKAAQGRFKQGRIWISDKVAGDPIELAKVLAHEIGHLVDWAKGFAGNTLMRGNMLGRLLTLNHFGREFHAEIGASDSAIRQELQALSQWWEPFDRADDPKYTRYRDQPKELYADAVSVLLNNPDALMERAPMFHQAFFEQLARKPEVKEAFESLRKMLTGPKEAIQDARIDRMLANFDEANAMRQDLAEAIEARKPGMLTNFMKAFVNKAAMIFRDLRGNPSPAAVAVRNALSYLRHGETAKSHFLDKVYRDVMKPLSEIGLNENVLGLYQTAKRIMDGRQDVGNPYGMNEGNAAEMMEHLRQRLSPEHFAILEKSAQAFQNHVFDIATKAYESGIISEKLYNEVILPNKDNYATFRPIDKINEELPPEIQKIIGSFKPHENPFFTTTMKMMSIQSAIDVNNARSALRDFYQKEFVGTMVRVKENDEGKTDSPPIGFKSWTIMEDGKPVRYHVDGYIVDAIAKQEVGDLERFVKPLGRAAYAVWHPLFVKYNLGFHATNPIRDLLRTYKLLPERKGESQMESAIKDMYRLPKAY